MRITKGQLRRIVKEETLRLREGAVPAAGRWGRQIEATRDQLNRIGRRVRMVWNDIADISAPDTADMLDTDFDIDAFKQQLNALDDQLVELQVALYDVDS